MRLTSFHLHKRALKEIHCNAQRIGLVKAIGENMETIVSILFEMVSALLYVKDTIL
jgi:hypothetical protein